MSKDTEVRVRFDRVISAIRAVIDSLAAQNAAWEELKQGTAGVYADSAIACSKARQAFEDETPTVEALVIALRDSDYKDSSWPMDGADDIKMLRSAWHSIHKTVQSGKSFAPDDIGMMRTLCAALERARDSALSTKYFKAKSGGRPKGASLSKDEIDCLSYYRDGKKPGDIDKMMMTKRGAKRMNDKKWEWGTAELVIEAAKERGEIPRKSRGKVK